MNETHDMTNEQAAALLPTQPNDVEEKGHPVEQRGTELQPHDAELKQRDCAIEQKDALLAELAAKNANGRRDEARC